MTEEQLEHLIRASGAILGDNEVLVIGSQSIIPWLRKWAGKPPRQWPGVFTLSTEADIIPIDNDEAKSDLIDGTLGEESYFHATHGYYAQGVSMETAKAPEGWQSRCYPMKSENTNRIVGHCMHPADLFIAKTLAGRPKDGPFLDAMIAYGLVQESTILHLTPKIAGCTKEEIQRIQEQIRARFQKVHRIDRLVDEEQKHHPVHEAHLQSSAGGNHWYTVKLWASSAGALKGVLQVRKGAEILFQQSELDVVPGKNGLTMQAGNLQARIDGDRKVRFAENGKTVCGALPYARLQPNAEGRASVRDREDVTQKTLEKQLSKIRHGPGIG